MTLVEIKERVKGHTAAGLALPLLDDVRDLLALAEELTRERDARKETIAPLTLEIRNLAHKAWLDPENAEYLFREIGKRAQKIAEAL